MEFNMRTIALILFIIFSNFCYADDNEDVFIKNIIAKSIANYPGKCACPYQFKSNGKRCGKSSAYSKPGGYLPLCYSSDITNQIDTSKLNVRLLPELKKNKIISYNLRIIDGDTIEVNSEKIRLHGIDTPETKQKCFNNNHLQYSCGERATKELRDIIGTNEVSCIRKDKDRYGRSVSVCYVKGQNINALLVERGWAVAYRKYSKDYVDNENKAKKNKSGLWSGKFMFPWNWRKQNR